MSYMEEVENPVGKHNTFPMILQSSDDLTQIFFVSYEDPHSHSFFFWIQFGLKATPSIIHGWK
jgi:hypothetical protein